MPVVTRGQAQVRKDEQTQNANTTVACVTSGSETQDSETKKERWIVTLDIPDTTAFVQRAWVPARKRADSRETSQSGATRVRSGNPKRGAYDTSALVPYDELLTFRYIVDEELVGSCSCGPEDSLPDFCASVSKKLAELGVLTADTPTGAYIGFWDRYGTRQKCTFKRTLDTSDEKGGEPSG